MQKPSDREAVGSAMGIKASGFLGGAALVLLLVVLIALTCCSLVLFAQLDLDGPYEEQIRFYSENLAANLLLTAVAMGALAAVHRLLCRFARVHLSSAMMALWFAAALFWIVGIRLIQERDCEAVMMAAQAFAQDDYALLHWGYFRGCPFQLGFVLLMEGMLRFAPGLDLNLAVQCMNVVLSVSAAGMLAAVAERAFGEGDAQVKGASLLLYAGFLPFLLFNVYTYGTIAMIFFCALALLCFTCYLRADAGGARRVRLLAIMAVSLALAYNAKPNAMIMMIAICICAALHALASRDLRPLLSGCVALALGVALSRLIVWQYELRSGFALEPNVSMLSWLYMGLSEVASMPGWYNGYVGRFFDMYLTPQAQRAVVHADLAALIPELLSDPAGLAAFMRDKLLSQWLEPTYSTFWYGYRCEWTGHFNGLAAILYRPGLVKTLATAYMNVYQQAMYVLACIGVFGCLKRRNNAAALALPVTLLGGLLFHQLFEAKSQYIYPYAIYMMPLAAYGLCLLEQAARVAKRARRG